MILLNYFLVFFLLFVTVFNVRADPEIDCKDAAESESKFRMKDRLFAQAKTNNYGHTTVYLYPRGRTVEAVLKTKAPGGSQNPNKDVVANIYFKKGECPNLSDLTGLKLRMDSIEPNIASNYEATFDGKKFMQTHLCVNDRTSDNVVYEPVEFAPVNKSNMPDDYDGIRARLEFKCKDYFNAGEEKNNFKIKIFAADTKCNFFVYFENANMTIPPEDKSVLEQKDLPFGLSLGTYPTSYRISLVNPVTLSFSSPETIPLLFKIFPSLCTAFETEIELNNGCSIEIKYEDDEVVLSTRGKKIRKLIDKQQIDDFMFGMNEKTITSVVLRNPVSGSSSEDNINSNKTHDFQAMDFCPTDKRNLTFIIHPKEKSKCREAYLSLGSYNAIILRQPDKNSTNITSSSEAPGEVETASFPWWPIVVAVAILLLLLGIGLTIFCLYRKGKICNKNPKPEDDPQAIVVAKTPITAAAADDDFENNKNNVENENENSPKDSKKEEEKEDQKDAKKGASKDLKKKKKSAK